MKPAPSERIEPWWDTLHPVQLQELNSVAGLQTRIDRKYIVRREDLDTVIPLIGGRVLDIDGRRVFRYWSTYFDTPERTSYFDAVRKRPRRWKVRVRTYLESDLHYVETKTRNHGRPTMKSRQPATPADHRQLSAASRSFVTASLAERLAISSKDVDEKIVTELQPALATEYGRVTILADADRSRVTVDSALSVSLPVGGCRLLADHVIIETKTTGRPSDVDHALWNAGVRPASISKFGVGSALLQPWLPASKWNRVLRQDFGWSPAYRPLISGSRS